MALHIIGLRIEFSIFMEEFVIHLNKNIKYASASDHT